MAQQINLCTPILLTQKRYFSAQAMVVALTVFVVLGGGLAALWGWGLRRASDALSSTLSSQTRELQTLQTALAQRRAAASSAPEQALLRELQARRQELAARERLFDDLQHGLMRPGWGHSARLAMVAQSIPDNVWVSELGVDSDQMLIAGYTLEPAALNTWTTRLAANPLLQGQQLASIKVEQVASSNVAPASAKVRVPVWTFQFQSSVARHAASGGRS